MQGLQNHFSLGTWGLPSSPRSEAFQNRGWEGKTCWVSILRWTSSTDCFWPARTVCSFPPKEFRHRIRERRRKWQMEKDNFGLEAVNRKIISVWKVIQLSWNFRLMLCVVFWLLLPQGRDVKARAMLWTRSEPRRPSEASIHGFVPRIIPRLLVKVGTLIWKPLGTARAAHLASACVCVYSSGRIPSQ